MRQGWEWLGITRILARTSAPAAAIGAIEDVQADLLHLFHRACPARFDIGGVIMGRRADLRQEDLSSSDSHRDFLCHLIMAAIVDLQLPPLAREGELAAVAP